MKLYQRSGCNYDYGITGNWKLGNLIPKTCIADNWRERAEENIEKED